MFPTHVPSHLSLIGAPKAWISIMLRKMQDYRSIVRMDDISKTDASDFAYARALYLEQLRQHLNGLVFPTLEKSVNFDTKHLTPVNGKVRSQGADWPLFAYKSPNFA